MTENASKTIENDQNEDNENEQEEQMKTSNKLTNNLPAKKFKTNPRDLHHS